MFSWMNRFVILVFIASLLSMSAQLLQFGPVVEKLENNGQEDYVFLVMGSYWVGGFLVCLTVGKLLDRIGKKVLLYCLPILGIPLGYLFTDYQVLIAVRFVHGVANAFLSITLEWMLRRLLPTINLRSKAPHKPRLWNKWRKSGDSHKKGLAFNASLSMWVGTFFSSLGFFWLEVKWPLVWWAVIACFLNVGAVGLALIIPNKQLESEPTEAQKVPEPLKKLRGVDHILALLPGIGLGVVGTVLPTYLPLYTVAVWVPLFLLVSRIGSSFGGWLVAFLRSGRGQDRSTMQAGIGLTFIGVFLLWASNGTQLALLLVSMVMLGVGTEIHRSTLGNQIYAAASPTRQGLAVALSAKQFRLNAAIGSLWGVLALVVGYRILWLTLLLWSIPPIYGIWRETAKGIPLTWLRPRDEPVTANRNLFGVEIPPCPNVLTTSITHNDKLAWQEADTNKISTCELSVRGGVRELFEGSVIIDRTYRPFAYGHFPYILLILRGEKLYPAKPSDLGLIPYDCTTGRTLEDGTPIVKYHYRVNGAVLRWAFERARAAGDQLVVLRNHTKVINELLDEYNNYDETLLQLLGFDHIDRQRLKAAA